MRVLRWDERPYMRWRWFQLDTMGAIATANLIAVGICGVIFGTSPGNAVRYSDVERSALALFCALIFPVGWVPELLFGGGVSSDPLPSILVFGTILIPLNAYLWGYIAARLIGDPTTKMPRKRMDEDSPSSEIRSSDADAD